MTHVLYEQVNRVLITIIPYLALVEWNFEFVCKKNIGQSDKKLTNRLAS